MSVRFQDINRLPLHSTTGASCVGAQTMMNQNCRKSGFAMIKMSNNRIPMHDEFAPRFQACLNARVNFDKACISRDVGELRLALDQVFEQVLKSPDIPLPFIASVPEIQIIVQAARTYAAWNASKEENKRYRAEWVAKLPTASQLRQDVDAAGKNYEFHGYTLWKENYGWSLTNAYGIDYCAFLSGDKHFEWLLSCVREGKDIGPVPPICQDTVDDYDLHEARIDACYDAALDLFAQLSKGEIQPGRNATELLK